MGTPVLPTMWSRFAVVLLSAASCHAGLLGAGTGEGSCAAAPFRAPAVKWAGGGPASAPCCSEYGYCQSQAAWAAGAFRDCNGQSNGTPLPPDAINAENIAAANGDARGLPLLGAGAVAVGVPAAGVGVGAGGYAAAAPLAAAGYAGYAGAGYAATAAGYPINYGR